MGKEDLDEREELNEELEIDDNTVCPNCGHHCGDDTVCPNCGAILGNEDDDLDGFQEDKEI